MNTRSERIEFIVQRRVMPCPMFGRVSTAAVVMVHREMPLLMVGTMLLHDSPRGWMISGIVIDDDDRRRGFATEAVDWARREFGPLGAAWASESGRAFARVYERTRGPQPWKICTDADDAEAGAMLAEIRHDSPRV